MTSLEIVTRLHSMAEPICLRVSWTVYHKVYTPTSDFEPNNLIWNRLDALMPAITREGRFHE